MAANIPKIKVSSDFLETNSMSHDSPFSAFAELIDNAYDAQAKKIFIEHMKIKDLDCVIFTDDGNGLDKNGLINMLSFGFSQKPEESIIEPIGRYGNGFKSSSMRLGDDVLVFSKTINDDCSVGFLSKRYNQNNETILIPTCSWKRHADEHFEVIDNDIHKDSFDAIVENSKLVKTEQDIKDIFNSHLKNGKNTFGFDRLTHGTIIVIYNLKEIDYKFELNFDKINDITINLSEEDKKSENYFSRFDSLREYLGLLYLSSNKTKQFKKKSNLTIKIQRKEIEDIYDKQLRSQHTYDFSVNKNDVKMIIGKKTPIGEKTYKHFDNVCTMIYYKNRLIECVDKKSTNGKCSLTSISIVQADFLQPKHNKQSFVKNDDYKNLRTKINEYNTKYMDDYINRNESANSRKNKKKIKNKSNVINLDSDSNEDTFNNVRASNFSSKNDSSNPKTGEDSSGSEIIVLENNDSSSIAIDLNLLSSNPTSDIMDHIIQESQIPVSFNEELINESENDDVIPDPIEDLNYNSIVFDESNDNQRKPFNRKTKTKINNSEILAINLWAEKDGSQIDPEVKPYNSTNIPKKRKSPSRNESQVSKTRKTISSSLLEQQPLLDELDNLRNVCIEIHQGIQENQKFIEQFEKCIRLAQIL